MVSNSQTGIFSATVKKKFPLFLAIAKPLQRQKEPGGKWLGPDWTAFYNEWNFYAGLKATLF